MLTNHRFVRVALHDLHEEAEKNCLPAAVEAKWIIALGRLLG